MTDDRNFDVIIIGGSYAGLSAAMSLGRALRRVLIIDSGKPCNKQTPHAHNFITQDGKTPASIAAAAKQQVKAYDTIHFHDGLATSGLQTEKGFEITTETGNIFHAGKLVFATGIKDLMPNVGGFAACWGISILHCPYCHGYEVRNEKTGIFGNGDYAFEFSKMISHWTKDLTVYTNGKSTLTDQQTRQLKKHGIGIVENEIDSFGHVNGQVQEIIFKDGSQAAVKAIYARPPFEQHCPIPTALGCALTEHGYLETDMFQKATVPGIYACGDNTSFMRSLSNAVAMGTLAGAMLNRECIEELFETKENLLSASGDNL